jgi:hypothetical protein
VDDAFALGGGSSWNCLAAPQRNTRRRRRAEFERRIVAARDLMGERGAVERFLEWTFMPMQKTTLTMPYQ